MTSPTNKKAPAPTKTQNAFLTSTDSEDYPTALLNSKADRFASQWSVPGWQVTVLASAVCSGSEINRSDR